MMLFLKELWAESLPWGLLYLWPGLAYKLADNCALGIEGRDSRRNIFTQVQFVEHLLMHQIQGAQNRSEYQGSKRTRIPRRDNGSIKGISSDSGWEVISGFQEATSLYLVLQEER